MLSIAFASLVTSDTTENSTVVCQGSVCQPKKAGSVTGTSETSKNKRRHSTAADSNSLKDHAKMAPNSESSIAGDSKSLRRSSETSVEQGGGRREKRWAYRGARGTRGSYFHPDVGRCIRKRNYFADDTSAESSIYHARPWRTKPEIRRRRRWRSNSGGITGNRHWFQNEPKGIVEPQSFRRLYRTPQYLERRNLEVPLRQTEGHGTVSDSQGRSIEHWGDDSSGPIRQWREPRSRLYREPRDSRHERGFWSKLFHFHSSSHNETKNNETTVSPSIQSSTSKQLVLNIPEVGKPETVQSPQDQESAKIDTISNTDPLLSKLEKELAVNVTTSKDLSPSPEALKVNFDPIIIESSELNNDHSEVSEDSGKELSGTETDATKDLWNEERDKAAGDTYKMAIAGADMENTESNDSLTITDFAEKMPEPQNLVPPQISLNETSESNCVDCPTSNNDGTDDLQQKLPEEQASKDLLTQQNPVSENYQMLMENTSIGDALPANNLAGKIVEFQNTAQLQLPLNETFQVKRAKSTALNRDHSKVSGYSSRIVAGTMSGMTKDFLSKQKHLPVDTTYKIFMTGPDTHNSITKGSWHTKDAAGEVGSTSDHRRMNGAVKESETTVNKRKYEEWPTSYLNAGRLNSDIIRKTESKRRRDVMDQNLRTTFSDQEQGVDQMPVSFSNTDFTGDASEVLPLKDKIHSIYEGERNNVYSSHWSSHGAQSSAHFTQPTENEEGIKSFNNEQKGVHWWQVAASDDSGIQNQQSLRPDESDSPIRTSGELSPFYMAVGSNKAMELEKKKSSKDDDLHHENTIAGKLISGLIKKPGEPLSASGLNGPTPEQAISRTHEGPMTPTYEDSYSEIIPVDYGPQDFDLGPSSISESQTENNKDTLEYLLPNNVGGNQWRQPLYHGHDMPYVHDIGGKGSHSIQHGSWWGSGAGVELNRRDQHLVSSQSVPVFQESDYNENSFRNSPEASSPGIFPRGALFPLSPSTSLDRSGHHPLAESGSHFHFSPTGSQHPMIGAAFLQSGGEHTVEQRLYKDSSHGLRHSQSVRSMSQSANSVSLPVSRELKQGAFEQGHINDLSKRNLVDGSTRQHSTADTAVARRLRVQRALHKFHRDITGQMQSNIPFNLPLSPQMNPDAYYNNPTGDVFQQSLPEMNVYNQDASQYNEYPSQNYLLQNQLLNMHTGPGNQYHQTSNTGYRTNLEFIPQNQPEYYESHTNTQFVPNSGQVETAIFQNPEVKTSNSPQTWFQPQNTYGSFEGYQAPPSLGAKTQGEKIPSQIGELYHEVTNDGEYPEPEKVPPQNYIPIYNYTFAEQKNVQIPIPNSSDSTYPSYDSDLPSRGMEGNQVSASLEPSIQYEYPKTIEVAKVQSPLYPFPEKSYNQRVSEASAPSSFSISNESLLERVEEIPMNGNSGLHDDVSFSTKAPDSLQHMSFVGHLAEQPSGLPVNGMPSGTTEKQSQQQQFGSLLSQHVHQTGVEPIMQQPPFHSVNSFGPPIKKSSSESEKLHQFGTMFPNELKSLHIHQPITPQKEESRLYSNSDSDAARAKYQKWLNERINTQARVLQALQPRSAPGQVFHQSGLNGPTQLSRGIVGVINPSGGNIIEGKMAPVQGDTNFTPVLKISVNLPTYPKLRKWDSPTQERPGALHPSQDNLIPGHKLIDGSSVPKVLDEKEHLRASSRRLLEQYVAPRYDVRKSSFQTFIPQSVATATWANKVAMIKSICKDHKGYGLVSSNTLHLPRNKRQVVIYDDFLRDLLKIMNIGERYLFSSSVTAGDEKINNTFMEDNDNNQLKQFSRNDPRTDDAESVKKEIEIRITADKLKDLCEILQDNPSLLDSVLSTINPEEAQQIKLESAVYQDPTSISLEQVENQSSNIPNERMLYENSAELPYSHEPHEGSDIGHMYETAGGTQTDHIHETGGDSHTDHIQYPIEGSNTSYLHDTGHDSHSDQWHSPDFDHYHHYADEVSHPDQHHDAGDAFHPDYYHNAGESPHSDHYHNAGEGAHPDHWPNADHSLNTNVGHSPHPDHWNNPMEIIHPGHWHNGEESSDTDHSYHPEDGHYNNHLSDTHNYDSYVTGENSHVFKTDEELGSEDTAEGHAMNHVTSMVEASVDTIHCDDHLEHKLTIQIPADIWKLLQEHSDARRGETLVTLQIEVPVLDHNDSNFEDFPVEALVNTKRNTLEKGKELQFHVSPSFVKADVTKLENERKASDSHYPSQDDVSSLHQRTVSEFLHSLSGMQRTPSFNGPESNASVLQFVPGIYPEGIGQTKRQENSYLIEKEGTRVTPGAVYSSGNAAGFHDNIAGLGTESKTRLAKNDPRLLSLSIYHSQPGGLKVLQEGGGMVPLRVLGPSGEVLYDTNKECQSVSLRAFPATPVPALVTEVRDTVKDRNACNNASCNQLIGIGTYSNGVPSKIPNVQLRSVDDLVRFFQNQNQPSEGRYRNLRTGGGPRYNLDSNSGNTRNIRASASKEEKEREMVDKVRSTQRHSLSKRTSDGLPSHSPDKTMVVDYKRYAADDLGISQRSDKTHRHTDEGEFVENNRKDKSRRLPYDSAVATMKLTIKHNNAPILRKDNSEANHFKVLTAEGGSIGTQRHKRRLLWLDDNEDEETLLPRVYPRNHQQLVVGTLSEQTGIVDEQPDVKANPFHHSSQFVERYSDVRGPLDSYNFIQHSTKRRYSHVGSSYFTDLGTSLRRQTKAGERLHVEAPVHRLESPHHQKRKSGLSHYFLKSQLARNHLLPNVEKGKYEPATWQPNSGKQRQRMFLNHRETKVNWHPKQSSQLRQSAYWSTGNIDKFNYPHVQLFDYSHFEPKRGSEVPDKNVSSAADRSLSTGNTTALAQNSEVNNNSIVPSQAPEPQQNRISQSTNTSVTFPPDHSEMSTLELNFNTRAISGNHSEDQSLTSTTETCTTVENHPHSGTNTAEGSGSGPDKVDASLDLRLKLQYDKNKGALEGEIQDLHFSPKDNESGIQNESNSNELKIQYDKNKGALEGEIQDFHYSPKENESHENGTQNHSNSNELQHTTSIRSDNTLSYLRQGSVFPAQSVKERLALFEYSVKHGGRYHTFHGMQNSFKRNFDLKEIPKNELPPSNYKSVHNFPFRHEDEALTDTMSHQWSSSNQYPYESSYSQNGVHPYPHVSYFSTNKNTDNVVLGQLTPAEFLQSQSSAETLSHSEPEKWNNENSQSASSSQMKQIENCAEDKVSNADRISRSLANKPHYERLDWMDRSPSYSSYVPEVSDFESLVGKRAGHMHDSYTITGSLASNTDEEDENLQQGSSQNRRQANVASGAPNQESIPLRATDEKNLSPFTYTSNEIKRNEATNVPIHVPVARSKLNVGVSAKDAVGIGADLDSLDEDWKHHADFDSIEIVHSFQHGRKILHENEDEADDDDDSDNPANDKLLFEYENLQNIRTKRKVNRDDSRFHIHPTSGDKFSNSKRSFHFRNHAKTQRTPKRLHPKFKGRSMAKSQRIPSIKKSETHGIKSINSEPDYLTTNLEIKKLTHPQDIQMRKTEKSKLMFLKQCTAE